MIENNENSVSNIETKNKNRLLLPFVILLVILAAVYFFITTNNKVVDLKPYTLTDVSSHSNSESCWTIINGNVYDVTKFIPRHEGGDRILNACGKDATDLFTGKSPMGRLHSATAIKLLSRMQIGTLQK